MDNGVDIDLSLAIQLQAQFDEELNQLRADEQEFDSFLLAGYQKKRKSQELTEAEQERVSVSLVDPCWELLDPNPNIRDMFLIFNQQFFWGRLLGIEVKWSPRMTLCAGVCSYEGRGGLCSIRLSTPLLKLRPRKDLVETLLHEMIHAYLFVTSNNRDRDGHGPQFHEHMYRVNKLAGTTVTVYHSFHNEVSSYRQHIWKCNGPCGKRPPYYGLVKRAMNRPPSLRDPWWSQHQVNCGGQYTKVMEPEGYGVKKRRKIENTADSKVEISESNNRPPSSGEDIRSFFPVLKERDLNSSQVGSSQSGPGQKSDFYGSGKDLRTTNGKNGRIDGAPLVNGSSVTDHAGKSGKIVSTNDGQNGNLKVVNGMNGIKGVNTANGNSKNVGSSVYNSVNTMTGVEGIRRKDNGANKRSVNNGAVTTTNSLKRINGVNFRSVNNGGDTTTNSLKRINGVNFRSVNNGADTTTNSLKRINGVNFKSVNNGADTNTNSLKRVQVKNASNSNVYGMGREATRNNSGSHTMVVKRKRPVSGTETTGDIPDNNVTNFAAFTGFGHTLKGHSSSDRTLSTLEVKSKFLDRFTSQHHNGENALKSSKPNFSSNRLNLGQETKVNNIGNSSKDSSLCILENSGRDTESDCNLFMECPMCQNQVESLSFEQHVETCLGEFDFSSDICDGVNEDSVTSTAANMSAPTHHPDFNSRTNLAAKDTLSQASNTKNTHTLQKSSRVPPITHTKKDSASTGAITHTRKDTASTAANMSALNHLPGSNSRTNLATKDTIHTKKDAKLDNSCIVLSDDDDVSDDSVPVLSNNRATVDSKSGTEDSMSPDSLSPETESLPCPICNQVFSGRTIYQHVDFHFS